ncbi:MAG: hypothetical protein WBL35_02510 [Ornithinibacter sp.]
MGTDPRRLDGLRSDERAAALLVEQATGATARAHDVAGRQAAYDVDLLHPDGRTGALEVTTHAGPARRDRNALLARDVTSWPNPGRWWWALDLADPDELPRLRAAYGRAIEVCEAHGLESPAALPTTAKAADPEVAWLAETARSRLVGRRPVSPGWRPPPVTVRPAGEPRDVDMGMGLLGLPGAVTDLLVVPHVARRAAKVAAVSRVDERHLFVGLGVGAVPSAIHLVLSRPARSLPTEDPDVPAGLTHLWLTTGWRGAPLVLWTREDGWRTHPARG